MKALHLVAREAFLSESWYALHVRSRFERHVRKNLELKGCETFVPTYEPIRRWSGPVKPLALPLFPNYVFCRLDLNSRLPVLMTPGVNFIVGAGKNPVPADMEEIAAVRHVAASGLNVRPHPYVNAGEVARIKAGPLEGLTGIVLRAKGCDRLIVSISILMRSVGVEISRDWVESIEPSLKETSVLRSAQIATS